MRSGVQHLEVAGDEAEQRLDRWFRKRFPQVTQGRLEKLCRKGEVRVDGARVKTSTRVGPGQTVRVPPLPSDAPVTRTDAEGQAPSVTKADAEMVRSAVIFRDDDLIVLNKPAGLAVQGGTGQARHLGAFFPALRFDRDDDPRLVHRLDKETSGVLVLARTGRAAAALGRAFRGRDVEKIYVAAVAGRPSPSAGIIRYGLQKVDRKGEGEKMRLLHPDEVNEAEGGRHAVTKYRVIEQAGNRAAWVALQPVTGRTHQLRAHMAALGTPIAGDGKYGGRHQENQGDGWGAGLGQGVSRKLHLHAARLSFQHPASGHRLVLNAPLPEHMARTWELFGWQMADLPDPIFEDLG